MSANQKFPRNQQGHLPLKKPQPSKLFKNRTLVRVVDRKRFDTQTAIEIAAWENGLPPSDYYHISETLYRTKNGTYFLAGSGGPLTKYAFTCGGVKGYGSGIIPLCEDDAYEWLNTYC